VFSLGVLFDHIFGAIIEDQIYADVFEIGYYKWIAKDITMKVYTSFSLGVIVTLVGIVGFYGFVSWQNKKSENKRPRARDLRG